MHRLPTYFGMFSELGESIKNIEKFLSLKEMDESQIKKLNSSESTIAVEFSKGSFSWGGKFQSKADKEEAEKAAKESTEPITEETEITSEPLILSSVQLKIKKGEFVAIIGEIGSGKSSLLSAMAGEMINKSINNSPIAITDELTLVQQLPWIQNKTIRENILFNAEFNEDRYLEVLVACELVADLYDMKDADQTEIGEKGINLSGGQKARISLARALYQTLTYPERNIVLMDDPLSALDAGVKRKIFNKCMLGLMGSTTRILVTHAIDSIHKCDRIVVLDKGEILLDGSYDEIKDHEYMAKLMEQNSKIQISSSEPSTTDSTTEDSQDELPVLKLTKPQLSK